jgi:hypothetical protein
LDICHPLSVFHGGFAPQSVVLSESCLDPAGKFAKRKAVLLKMRLSGNVNLAGQAKGDCRALAGSGVHPERAAETVGAGLHIGQAMAHAPRIVEGIESLAVVADD